MQLSGDGELVGGECWWSAADSSSGSCGGEAGHGAVSDEVAFELGLPLRKARFGVRWRWTRGVGWFYARAILLIGGRVRQRWDVEELVESWTLDAADDGLVRNKTGATRLGFALCPKFFELEGRFPGSAEEIPVEVVDFVARQVGVRFNVLGDYDWSGRSWKRHRAQIRARYGFRTRSASHDPLLLAAVMVGPVADGRDRDQMLDFAYSWCRGDRIVAPAVSKLDRLFAQATTRFEQTARSCGVTARASRTRRSFFCSVGASMPRSPLNSPEHRGQPRSFSTSRPLWVFDVGTWVDR